MIITVFVKQTTLEPTVKLLSLVILIHVKTTELAIIQMIFRVTLVIAELITLEPTVNIIFLAAVIHVKMVARNVIVRNVLKAFVNIVLSRNIMVKENGQTGWSVQGSSRND